MHKLIKRNKRMTGLDATQPSEASEENSDADMYCWGDPINGALGLGETRESNILAPREVKFNKGRNVKCIASGLTHTLVLLNGGEVYSCGSNSYGQLGHERPNTVLHLIDSLAAHKIVAVACGEHHSLALTAWGQVLSWGCNSVGQLGLNIEEPNVSKPRIIKDLVTTNIVQIACGRSHCLVLANDGKLYSWGLNDSGQLGLGPKDRLFNAPQYIESLLGLPISLIACGGYHSFCLSKSGAVYGWGKNNFGQLGLVSLDNHTYPSQLKTLRAMKVKYIVCGEDFSVFLTQDGGVLTCGSGSFGQLGHNSKSNEVLPRKVIELMGTMVTQVVCGRFHTLAFVASQEKVLAFGLGTSGQLGNNELMNSDCPVVVQGPWANGKGFVEAIYSGGNHCFVTVTSKKRTADYRHHSRESNIWTINLNEMKQCEDLPENQIVDQDLLTYLETVLGSQACINGSFLLAGDQHYCSSTHHGVEMETAQFCFTAISRTNNTTIKDVCLDKLSSVLQNLSPSPPDVETLRLYLTLPLYHEFDNTRHFNRIQKPFCLALLSLKTEPSKIVGQWYYMANEEYFERLVRIYKNALIDLLTYNNNNTNNTGVYWRLTHCDRSVISVLDLLAMLYRINYKNNKTKLNQEQFYIPELTTHVDVRVDFIRLATDSPSTKVRNKYLCNYPFIFDAEAKMQLLQTDQSLQMNNASLIATHIPLSLLQPGDPPPGAFLELYVRRDRLLQDTITQLGRATETDYKKPLKVTFIDEEAEDAGGVRKEFFMLILPEVLDPKYGMFKTAHETNNLWFSEFTFEDETMFFIVGLLCGLAIYNFIIINVPFPLALYKKLLGEPVHLSDLMDLSPTVARSLQTLLDYDNDDVEDVFCLTFEILIEVYGEKKIIHLKPNGGDIPVTKENKKEYVDLYVDYIFNESVKNHYNSFHYAFHKVCGGEILKLFRAQELMAVVTGSENYDWETLENNTEYKNGYVSSDKTIRLFWEVFHELPEEEKKKFLLFLTGTDRIPIQGMQAIKIYIQPTRDDRFLPVAHTCFNLLDLPRYSTKERLRYKLLQAIQNNQGFSLV